MLNFGEDSADIPKNETTLLSICLSKGQQKEPKQKKNTRSSRRVSSIQRLKFEAFSNEAVALYISAANFFSLFLRTEKFSQLSFSRVCPQSPPRLSFAAITWSLSCDYFHISFSQIQTFHGAHTDSSVHCLTIEMFNTNRLILNNIWY